MGAGRLARAARRPELGGLGNEGDRRRRRRSAVPRRPPAHTRPRPQVTGGGLRRAALHEISILALALALLNTLLLVRWGIDNKVLAFDFRGTLWDAGIAIRDGHSPYPAPVVDEIQVGNPALYPPLLMLLVTPLTFLPWALGARSGPALSARGGLGALRPRRARPQVLRARVSSRPRVRRLFGNATLLLVPLVALAWRWRDHWLRTVASRGLVISSKLFLWPLLFWLLGTRRYRALQRPRDRSRRDGAPWVVIGFAGIASYPDLLRVA